MITQERLDEMWEAAVRDDMHTILVPSDVRTLIRTIRELQADAVPGSDAEKVREVCAKIVDELAADWPEPYGPVDRVVVSNLRFAATQIRDADLP